VRRIENRALFEVPEILARVAAERSRDPRLSGLHTP
jgi:hypothetical protein